MDSAFLVAMAAHVATRGVSVARFEFDYMAARRTGGKRPPPRMPLLLDEYTAAVAAAQSRWPDAPLFIGGKSMGGRAASMIAGSSYDSGTIKGCVCLGYPFHPTGKPLQLRTGHLLDLSCPTLVVQGERDALGSRTEVAPMALAKTIELVWLADGDHDLKPRKASGHTHAQHLAAAADAVAAFVRRFA